ncbi:hypothetical protein ACRAWD_22865 [Caulobacter segnis]
MNSFFLSATVTFVQGEAPPERRVISGAPLLLVMNLIGLGLGPTFVGMASDHFLAPACASPSPCGPPITRSPRCT